MTNKVTRAARSVWVIGGTDEDFKVSKFPYKKEVLKVLFRYRIEEKLSLKDSIEKTSSLILPIWDKARIPTKAPAHVVEHKRILHAEWQGLKKRISRSSGKYLKNQQMFQDRLDDLFDIAHRDAMSLIDIEKDRLFLEAQREKGRRGTIAGVDRNLTLKEKRVMKRKASAAKYALLLHGKIVSQSLQ